MYTKSLSTILLIIVSLSCFSQQPQWEWAKSYGEPTNWFEDFEIYSVCNDSIGNIYIAGIFDHNSITIDTITLKSTLWNNLFIAKLTNTGSVIWAKVVHGTTRDIGLDIICDGLNIYITGTFELSIAFQNSIFYSYGGNNEDVFIVKYDTNGNEIWAKQIKGNDNDYVRDIDYYGSNLAITGYFHSPQLFCGNDTLNLSYLEDIFISKLDTCGNFLWSRSFGGDFTDRGYGISIDKNNSIVFTGSFKSSTLLFDSYLLVNSGNSDLFIAKISTNGIISWAQQGFGTFNDNGRKVKIDSNNKIVVLGCTQSSVFTIDATSISHVSSGSYDLILSKFDSNGNLIWITNPNDTDQSLDINLEIDGYNNIYIAGEYYNSFDFYNNVQISSSNPNTGTKPFITKYSTNGIAQWAIDAEGTSQGKCLDISIDHNDNVIVVGDYFTHQLIFEIDTLNNNGYGQNFAFITKLTAPENTIDSQFVSIEQGWSMISTYINPENQNMDTVFYPVSNSVVIGKDEDGMVYWPQYSINFIGDLSIGKGYQFKMDTTEILNITGNPIIPYYNPLEIESGWNIIGYLRQSAMNVDSIFSPISSNLILLKDDQGDVYWPMFGINNVGHMFPGEGYQVKMQVTDTLTYPAN